MNINRKDLAHCRQIHRKYGKNYFFATRFFPKDLRHATHVLYAFFRVPDEIVDASEGIPVERVKKHLTEWEDAWFDAYEGGHSDDPVIRASVAIFHTYGIPVSYAHDFLKAMKQDLVKHRYQTYAELEEYMYGSAAVVGLIMTHVIGFTRKEALPYAKALGEAMQLTNFLRDIEEDVQERGRIYLPQEDLERFGCTEQDVMASTFSSEMSQLMKYEMERARALYREAEKGIPLLRKRGRLAVRLALFIYEAILDKLEQQNRNPFSGKAKTTLSEKMKITLRILWM